MANLRVDDITATKNLASTFQKVKSGTDSPKKDLDLKKFVVQEPEILDEPILRENKNRFVLFPIKYNDVSTGHLIYFATLITYLPIPVTTDMANVQEGRSLLLGCRGD